MFNECFSFVFLTMVLHIWRYYMPCYLVIYILFLFFYLCGIAMLSPNLGDPHMFVHLSHWLTIPNEAASTFLCQLWAYRLHFHTLYAMMCSDAVWVWPAGHMTGHVLRSFSTWCALWHSDPRVSLSWPRGPPGASDVIDVIDVASLKQCHRDYNIVSVTRVVTPWSCAASVTRDWSCARCRMPLDQLIICGWTICS